MPSHSPDPSPDSAARQAAHAATKPSPGPATATRPGRRTKASAVDGRAALLLAASKLFAEQGVEATSTREICTAAGLNPGAIHYHFGDKEGLYRALLLEPIEAMSHAFAGFDTPGLGLREALTRLLTPFLSAPQAVAEDSMRLFLNEMLRPSPVFAQAIRDAIAPHHHAMARFMAQQIGCDSNDPLVHQLVYGLLAMAHDYCMGRAFQDLITPRWLEAPGAVEGVRDRLIDWALALVEMERQRCVARSAASLSTAPQPTPVTPSSSAP
jgi:TetR/AcrR family transcriptional regulator, regulator of cefoperazone and chloramphenicol sensitivity